MLVPTVWTQTCPWGGMEGSAGHPRATTTAGEGEKAPREPLHCIVPTLPFQSYPIVCYRYR